MVGLFSASARRPSTLTLRLEELETAFDETVDRVLTFGGLLPEGAAPSRAARQECDG